VCSNVAGIGRDAELDKQLARFRALLDSDRALPRVATLMAHLAALHRLQAAMARDATPLAGKVHGHADEAKLSSLREESYRLEVEVYAEEKALGIACFSNPPQKPIAG
jgi:hypothetical protein